MDDARIGMKSTALTFGGHTKPALAGALAVSAGCLAAAGAAAGLHWPHHAAVAAATAHAACQDKMDDARIGMKSTALTFGGHTKPALAGALAVSAGCLAAAGAAAGLHWPHHAAVAAATAHAACQIYTLDPDNQADCASKFKSNTLIGLIILLGILGGGYTQYIDNRSRHRGHEDHSVTSSCLFG